MKITVRLEIETDGSGESEIDYCDDARWLALLEASPWFVTDVTSAVEANCRRGSWS